MMIKYGLIGVSGRMGGEIREVMTEKGHSMVYSLSSKEETFRENPQLIIDFSLPAVFQLTMEKVRQFGVPLIIGTTGLDEEQLSVLKELSSAIPVVQSYNFSIGIQMLLKCAAMLKEHLNDWDMEIMEAHHRYKKDKPSGTAKMISDVLGGNIPVSSLRLGNIAGDHTVYFGGTGEVLSITHSATSRRTFAEGVLRSAEFISGRKSGLYTFQDVLFGEKR